jgi:hypothetical protein
MLEFEGTGPRVVTIEEIVNKPSWNSEDVEFLVEHQDLLDDETLEKLGIQEIVPLTLKEVEALYKPKKTVAKKK